jgi:hypothetical protein
MCASQIIEYLSKIALPESMLNYSEKLKMHP